MKSAKVVASLAPWAAFSILVRPAVHGGAVTAALVACAVALAGLAWALVSARSFAMVEATGVVVFAVLAGVASSGDTARSWVVDFGAAEATMVLAIVMLTSSLTFPFTEQAARGTVPRAYWISPVFRAVNGRVSATWGAAVLAVSVGFLISGCLSERRPYLGFVLDGCLPIAVGIAAIVVTRRLTVLRQRKSFGESLIHKGYSPHRGHQPDG